MGELITQASLGFSPVPTPWTLDFSMLGSSMSLCINQPRVSVAQLLQAERISLNWNESISLFHQEKRLGLDAFLTAATETSIQLHLQAGQVDRKQPTKAILLLPSNIKITIKFTWFHQAAFSSRSWLKLDCHWLERCWTSMTRSCRLT